MVPEFVARVKLREAERNPGGGGAMRKRGSRLRGSPGYTSGANPATNGL